MESDSNKRRWSNKVILRSEGSQVKSVQTVKIVTQSHSNK